MAEQKSSIFLPLLLFLFSLPSLATSVTFNFTGFGQGIQRTCTAGLGTICAQGDAFSNGPEAIQLTKNEINTPINNSVGRVFYSDPVPIWDPSTRRLADFVTHFSFVVDAFNSSMYGEGLAFFLSPYPSQLPADSYGGALGLFPNRTALDNSTNQIVAVEFDSFQNEWDPAKVRNESDHVGIDVNSIDSVKTVVWESGIRKGKTANAWVSYDSATRNLSVFLTYADNPSLNGSSLSLAVNLAEVLPSQVAIGFSASTGTSVEVHKILSWDFNSTLELSGKKQSKTGLAVGVSVGAVLLLSAIALVYFALRRRERRRKAKELEESGFDVSIEDEFEKGRGPQRFPYKDLAKATRNFSEEGRLGEGGFGAVYRGRLAGTDVAIKRVSKGSKQGRKEYVSEVRIISRLRHRNLVQLIGWCHDGGELLLVYEYMPNGSLDFHLFKADRGPLLTWPVRYKVAVGLASALLYLHEEWEQCVVHRDVKSSNVMLDSAFNAKLGDFGLARLVDHDRGSQTTVLAGTMGYMAPECVMTGKASKESDVYSFGVVALEIACGRKAVEPKAEEGKVSLVEWVWKLYGAGGLLEAADGRLGMDFDEEQMQRLMGVGLWCANPDVNLRPSIRQAIATLGMEAPMPSLPEQMPVAMYFAPPLQVGQFTYTSASEGGTTTTTTTGSSGVTTTSGFSTASTRGSVTSPTVSLLYPTR